MKPEKHGLSGTYEHRVWKGMRNRCLNPRHHTFKNYGGRGISICKRWDSFTRFLKDLGSSPSHKHSIDRINNNGDYKPSNCRWADRSTQMKNKRNSRMLTLHGKTMNMVDWSIETGLHYDAIRERLNNGWPIERALDPKWKKPARTHCANGHIFNKENTYLFRGMKKCRICVREAGRRRDLRDKSNEIRRPHG